MKTFVKLLIPAAIIILLLSAGFQKLNEGFRADISSKQKISIKQNS